MVTYPISPDCVAAILSDSELVNEQAIRKAVASCLEAAGCRPWPDIEAELYCLEGRRLLIARPRAPVRKRLSGHFPRLRRSS